MAKTTAAETFNTTSIEPAIKKPTGVLSSTGNLFEINTLLATKFYGVQNAWIEKMYLTMLDKLI